MYFYPREGINEGPEGFAAPVNSDEESLEQGVVFNREDAQSDKFKARRRIIPHDEFLEFASRVRDV
ncbi:hypothetical protein ACR30L_03665 [Psychromonas sp. PT13]|uniref:hypothetical protein n=1 Tax=Psychromonas sp. PT13 TaxID=3439547 RepID=UPI003EBD3C02